MYQVEKLNSPTGRDNVIVVSMQGRRVGSASLRFVRWMNDCVPKSQLRPEQAAMVDWLNRQTH